MTDHHDNVKRPHGETGDTVQQAAEVSKPTSSVGHVLTGATAAQVPHDSITRGGTRADAGAPGDAGAGNSASGSGG